jgi:hypothetical protein
MSLRVSSSGSGDKAFLPKVSTCSHRVILKIRRFCPKCEADSRSNTVAIRIGISKDSMAMTGTLF